MTRSLWLLAIGVLFVVGACARAQTASGSFDRALNVGEPLELDVQTGSGSIDIKAGAAGKVEIHGEIRVGGWEVSGADELGEKIKASPPIGLEGKRLRVGRPDETPLEKKISINQN